MTEVCGSSSSGKSQVSFKLIHAYRIASRQLLCCAVVAHMQGLRAAANTRSSLFRCIKCLKLCWVQLALTLVAAALRQGETVVVIDCAASVRVTRIAEILTSQSSQVHSTDVTRMFHCRCTHVRCIDTAGACACALWVCATCMSAVRAQSCMTMLQSQSYTV